MFNSSTNHSNVTVLRKIRLNSVECVFESCFNSTSVVSAQRMEFNHTGLFVPTDESTLLLGAASPSLKEICQVRAVLGPPRSDKHCEILLLPAASKSLADFNKAMVILRNYMNLLIKHHWSIDSDRVKAVTFCEVNNVKKSNVINSKSTDSVKTSSSAVTNNESAIAPVRSSMNRLTTVQMKNKNDNISNCDSTHNQKLDKLKENKIPSLPILTGCTSSKRTPAPIRKSVSNTDLNPSKSKKRKVDKPVENKSSSMLSTLAQGNASSSNGVVNVQELQRNRIESLMQNKIISQDRRTVLISPCFELFTANNSEKSTIVHSAKSTASSSANVVTNVKQQNKTSIIGIETRKMVATICTNNKTISISQPQNTNVASSSDKLVINDSIKNVEIVNLIDDDETLAKTNSSRNINKNNNGEILFSSSNNVSNFSSSKNALNTMFKDNEGVIVNDNTNSGDDDDDIIICSDNISIKDSEEELFGNDYDVEDGECTDVDDSDEDIVLILNDSDNGLESDDITVLPTNNKSSKPRRCNRLKEDTNRISDLSESDVLIDENVSVIEIENDESKEVILISENEENVNSNNSKKPKKKRLRFNKKMRSKKNRMRELRKMNRQELLEQGYRIQSQDMLVRKKSQKSTEVRVASTNRQESSQTTVNVDPVWVPPAHFASQYQNFIQTGPAPLLVCPYQMPTTSLRPVFNVTGVPIRSITTGAASSSKTSKVNNVGTNVCIPDDNKEVEKTGLRPVIIDASNVAFSHGRNSDFSFRGIEICIKYFKTRGHKVIAFLPNYRKSCINNNILNTWENDGTLVFTPSRKVNNSLIISHDDRYIIQCAAALEGIIVSKDNYRDFMGKNPIWDEAIKNRLLMFTFVGDLLMFPEDPLGRCGPTLDEFLRFPSS